LRSNASSDTGAPRSVLGEFVKNQNRRYARYNDGSAHHCLHLNDKSRTRDERRQSASETINGKGRNQGTKKVNQFLDSWGKRKRFEGTKGIPSPGEKTIKSAIHAEAGAGARRRKKTNKRRGGSGLPMGTETNCQADDDETRGSPVERREEQIRVTSPS